MNPRIRQAIKRRESLDLLFNLLIQVINYKEPLSRKPCTHNIQHIICDKQSVKSIQEYFDSCIYDYLSISKRIVEDRDSVKDSRMYSKLRSILYGSYRRMVLEDILLVHDLKMDVGFLHSSLVALRGIQHTVEGYENDLTSLSSMSQFLENQIVKMKELVASFALNFHIDLAGFDGFHVHTLDASTALAAHLIGDLFVLLECYNLVLVATQGKGFRSVLTEEGTISHYRINYSQQALHMSPSNGITRFFIGRLERFLKNPLASAFYLLSSLNTTHPAGPIAHQELGHILAYYRSEYIRLRTDLLSGLPPESVSEVHSRLNTRLCVYCLLYIVEICLMKVGISDAEYLLDHLDQHFHAMLQEDEDFHVSSLVQMMLIGILTVENGLHPFITSYIPSETENKRYLNGLQNESIFWSVQLLQHLFLLFIQAYPSQPDRFILPLAIGLCYASMNPVIFTDATQLVEEIHSFLNRACNSWDTQTTLSSVKYLSGYSSASVPYVLTYLQGVQCLQKIRDTLSEDATTPSQIIHQLLAPIISILPTWSSSTEDTISSVAQEGSDTDSIDEYMRLMADDIFMDKEEMERLNNNSRCFHAVQKSQRRHAMRKRQGTVRKPVWRAQNFRKDIPPTKDEFRLLQKVNRTNINNSFIIVLDISNIAVNYGNQRYCCRGIRLALDYFQGIGHKCIGFMHRKFVDGIKKINPSYYERMTPDDIPYLQSLIKQRIINTCPDYEDAYIIQYAIEHRAIVVSNDKFRDFIKRYPDSLRPIMQRFLATHVMPFAFTEDSFCPSNEFIYPDLIEDTDSESEDECVTQCISEERIQYYGQSDDSK